MNISIKTPASGVVGIQPDILADVCPMWFVSTTNQKQKIAGRRYCKAEGWIELAEENLDPPLDPDVGEFLRKI